MSEQADELRSVNQRLHVIGQETESLWRRRAELMQLLSKVTVKSQPRATVVAPADGVSDLRTDIPQKREWTARRVQNLLLSLGASLLVIAALLFVAYAWGWLGVEGKAAILAAVTVAAFYAGVVTSKRGLLSTGESLTAVGFAMTFIDAAAARAYDLFDVATVNGFTYWTVVLVFITVGAALHRSAFKLRSAEAVGFLSAQLPLALFTSAYFADSLLAWSTAISLQVSGLAAFGQYVNKSQLSSDESKRLWAHLAGASAGLASVVWLIGAVVVALLGISEETHVATFGSLFLLISAAVLVSIVSTFLKTTGRVAAYALICVSAAVAGIRLFSGDASGLVMLILAVILLAGVPAVPRYMRAGGAVAATALLGLGFTFFIEETVLIVFETALVGVDGWTGFQLDFLGAFASQYVELSGTVVVAAVLTTLGAYVALRAIGTGQWSRLALVFGGVISFEVSLAVTAISLAIGLALYSAACFVVLVGSSYVRSPLLRQAGYVSGWLLLVQTTALAASSQLGTLVTLPLLVFLLVVLGAHSMPQRSGAGVVAVVLSLGWLWANLVGLDIVSSATAALIVFGVGVAMAVALEKWQRAHAFLMGPALAAGGVAGIALTQVGSSANLGWAMLIATAALAVLSLRPHWEQLRWAAATTMLVFVWLRLAIGGVDMVEAYSLPLAALVWALALSSAATSSWSRHGFGILLALVPTVAVTLVQEDLARTLIALVGAGLVLAWGAKTGQKAPLTVGGGLVLLLALQQFGPYVALVPRWLAVATVGSVLLGVGATYERRLHEVRVLADRFQALK